MDMRIMYIMLNGMLFLLLGLFPPSMVSPRIPSLNVTLYVCILFRAENAEDLEIVGTVSISGAVRTAGW